MKKLNNRQVDIMSILADGTPKTSSQITRSGEGLTQSTVQAALRHTLAARYVEAVGVTHSGNVLSREFELTEAGRNALLEDFVNHYRRISAAVSLPDAIAALQQAVKGET